MSDNPVTALARKSATLLALTIAAMALAVALASAPPATQSAPPPDEVSDFGPPPPSSATAPAATAPSVSPTVAAPVFQSSSQQDALIGQAIERGISFLRAQFRSDQLAPVGELSDSQLQPLDALCVYALEQAAQTVTDPRLPIKGKVLSSMLDRLCSFELITDAQKMNRPITYGRSLRAAALALADRPQDRPVLKADVAWLIKAEIGGAYTYDDFYNTLKQHGVVPSSSSVQLRRSFQVGTPKPDSLLPTKPDDISARVVLAQDFGGGSGDPGLGGGTDPYPPVSPWPPTNIPVPVSVTQFGLRHP